MKSRQEEILKAIIKHFTETAEPVGSNTILVSYKFDVSPATIRNDMVTLEKQGLLYQPHTSAGRVPTDLAYRLYVDSLADYETARATANQKLQSIREHLAAKRIKQKVYDAVSLLAQATENVSFATLSNQRTFYLGIANVLRQPEFTHEPQRAGQIFEVLEDNDNFLNFLHTLDLEEKAQIYIGDENIIEKIKSCSIIVARYEVDSVPGYIGILGPTRMNYPVNTIIIEEIRNILEREL